MKSNKGILLVLFGALLIAAPLLGSSIEHPFSGMIKTGTTIKPAVPTDLVEVDAIEFTEDDTDPTCAAGNYNIFADLSDTAVKICNDGTLGIVAVNGVAGWVDNGTEVVLDTSTDEVVIGGATPINVGKLSIDGDADQVQFAIQGNATQTTNLIEHENSAGTVLYSYDNIGIETVFGGVEFLDDDTDPACAAGNYNIFADLSETALKMCNNGTATVIATNTSVTAATFTAGWNVGAASFLQSFDVSGQDAAPEAVFFRQNGLQMYMLGDSGNDITEYVLSTAWDVTTAGTPSACDISGQGTSPGGLFIRADGLKAYTTDINARTIAEWDLSPAWDISTCSFLQNKDISGQGLSPSGVFLRDDGLKAYVTDFNDSEVNEYDLSVAWDITSAGFLQLFDVSTEEATPQDLFLKDDGTKLFVVGSTTPDKVYEYDLGTAWDITTAVISQTFDLTGQTVLPTGMFIRISDGVKMYIAEQTNDNIHEYDLGFFLDNNTTITGTTHAKVATDGDSILSILENSEPHAAASTNETAQLRFGFGGDLDVARIVVGKEDDYDPGAGENDSFMAFYTDLNGTATEAGRFTGAGRLGVNTETPNGPLDVTGNSPGNVGGFPAGALQITSPTALINANAVITGHNVFGGNKQLWYLGSSSTSNDNVTLRNRQNGSLDFATNDTTAMTISSGQVVTLTNDLAVTEGGTGAGTFTDGGILLGSGTGAFTPLGVATNGQIPIGDGATDPVLATITGTANEITVTNGAGSITVDIPSSPTLSGTTTLDTAGADTVAISTFNNTGGNVQDFITSATPEGAITGSIGDMVRDHTNGMLYFKQTGSATNTGWQAIAGISTFKSYGLANPGTADTFYVGGHYGFAVADANLTIGGTVVQTFGTAGEAHGAHAFAVASGAGGTDLVLTVTGVSITEAGVRNASDSEIIVADADAAVTDQYFETSKKWLGQITYTLTGSSGTFDFNYGFAVYEDFGNRAFTVTDFEATGEMRANETGLNIELLHHEATAFTYNASAFVPNQTALVSLATDYSTDNDVATGLGFAYKRRGFDTAVNGADSEGLLIRVTTAVNNSINDASFQIGVLVK